VFVRYILPLPASLPMPQPQYADAARDVEKLPLVKLDEADEPARAAPAEDAQPPTFLGMPLKYVS
jgi:hypothetical protein